MPANNHKRNHYRGVATLNREVGEEPTEFKTYYDRMAEVPTLVWRQANVNNDRVMSAAGWPTP
jgi:hypothetical protein